MAKRLFPSSGIFPQSVMHTTLPPPPPPPTHTHTHTHFLKPSIPTLYWQVGHPKFSLLTEM